LHIKLITSVIGLKSATIDPDSDSLSARALAYFAVAIITPFLAVRLVFAIKEILDI